MTGNEIISIISHENLGNEELMTIEEVAKVFAVSKGTVHQWIRKGAVRTLILMGNNVITRSSIENFLNRKGA